MPSKILLYLVSPFVKNEKEIPALNGIRAIAILLVIVYHVWLPFQVSSFPKIFQNFLSNFNSGVDLFFVLSGFLIYSGIIKYTKESDLFSKKKFFIARTLRIFPAYYFCLLILYLYFQGQFNRLSQIANPNEFQMVELNSLSATLQSSYADILYISNYTERRLSLVGWSLSIEEQFYLILPFFSTLFLLKLDSKKRIFILTLLYIVPLFFRIFYTFQNSDLTAFIYSHARMDSLIAGMILAEMVFGVLKSKIQVQRSIQVFLFGICVLLLTLGHAFPLEEPFRKTFGFNCFNLGYGILIYLSLQKKSWIVSILSSVIFRPIARLSYTMYLWNILIAGIAVSKVLSVSSQLSPRNFILAVLTACVYCFLGSWILYLLIERPFLILKEKILAEKR
ncbi:acyltransferase family protein [Leptospira sp. WS92.C1]